MSAAVDCHYGDDGEGPCVIFVHGIGSSLNAWDGIIPALLPRFRCVRMDLRGHARSPRPPLPYSLEALASDVERVRERVGAERTFVVGHSLGGMIGPAYARRYPERVLGLGLLSTAAGRTPEDSAKVTSVVAATRAKGVAAMMDAFIERWFTAEFGTAHPEVIEARKAALLANDPEVFLEVFRIYAETEMAPWLNEIEAPALVLTGAHDGGCPPRLNAFIAGELQRAELVILKGLKHSILLEAPDRVAAPLLAFLDRHADGKSEAGA